MASLSVIYFSVFQVQVLLLSVTVQSIAWKDLSPNCLLCFEWNVKPCYWLINHLIPYHHLLGMSTSHCCCMTFTGCGLRNASLSCGLCSFTDACMVWRHGIFPTTTSVSPILSAAVPGRHPHSWWSDEHSSPLLAIVCFRWLEAALEQSATRRHFSSNADCFSEPPQNSPLFLIISFLTVFGF